MDTIMLEELGLTKSEIKVYLSLLELGDSTRGDIVNKSGIAGSKVYENLEKLQNKGLVSIYTKNKIKHFKPTNPKQLMYYVEEKKEELREIEQNTKAILPQLLSQFQASKEEQEVELLTGLKGLEIWFREQVEQLKKGECNYVIGGTRGTQEEHITAFFQKIHRMREKKGIKTKMLYNDWQKKTTEERYGSQIFKHSTTRYISHSNPVSVNIYKDRTLIIIFGKKLSAIHIKSQDVANSFLEYFNILWKQSKK